MLLTAIAIMLCGLYVRDWSQDSYFNLSYPTTFMNQVSQDWASEPYSDLMVVNATSTKAACPADYPNIVMGRKFYGTMLGCDCLGIYGADMTGDNSMIPQMSCDYNQTRYGC